MRELAVHTDTEHTDTRSSPRGVAPLVVMVAAVAAIGGLTYGFLLGRGDRPSATPPDAVETTTTLPNSPPTTALIEETTIAFARSPTGRDLGAGVTEYLDPNLFTTLVARSDGTIWAGGASGVVSFDPQTEAFTRLSTSDGTGPLNVQFIAEGPEDTWLATNRGLTQWRHGERIEDSRSIPGDGLERWVTGLAVGDNGEVWLTTVVAGSGPIESQIHHTRPPFVGDIPSVTIEDYVQALQAGPDGHLWALAGRMLWEYDGEWHETLGPESRRFNTMAVDTTGDIWFASEGRLFLWNGTDLIERFWGTPAIDPNDPLGGTFITRLTPDPDAGVWALVIQVVSPDSIAAQIVRVGDGPAESVPLPDRVEAPGPWDLVVAPDGAVWMAAGSSLLRYDGDWTEYRIPDVVPIGSLGSIAAGPADEVWTASPAGIVHRSTGGWRLYQRTDFGREPADHPAEPSQEFWVANGSGGEIWGGIGCHAYRFDAGAWVPLPPLPDVTELCWAPVATSGPDGSLWMSPGCCFTETPVYHLDEGGWKVLEPPVTENTGMAVSADGGVWLTSFSGIAAFDGTEWTRVMDGNEFAAIAAGGDGRVWAAGSRWSTRAGLWVYESGDWSLMRPGVTIEALATGPDGTVWALETQPNGRVDLVNTATGRVRFITEAGLVRTLAISEDGVIWVGGEGRLYRVDPLD